MIREDTVFIRSELFHVTDDGIQILSISNPRNKDDKLNTIYKAIKDSIRKYTESKYLEVSRYSPNGLGKVLNRDHLLLDVNDATSDVYTILKSSFFAGSNPESAEGASGSNFQFDGITFEDNVHLLIYLYDIILKKYKFLKQLKNVDLIIDSLINPKGEGKVDYRIPNSYILAVMAYNNRIGRLKLFDGFNWDVLVIPSLKELRDNTIKIEDYKGQL